MWKSQGRLLGVYRPGRLGQNTLFGTVGLGARAVIQAAYLLIVSRWLGAEGYGLFAGSVALVILAAPLANWGSSLLLTRSIALDRTSSRAIWATALVQTGAIGSLLVLVVLAASVLLVQQRLLLAPMLLLALSELLLLPAVHAATSQCYALDRGIASAVVTCLVPLGRTLVMVGVIAFGFVGTPNHAAFAHFIGSALGFVAAVAAVALIDGLPDWRSRLPLRDGIRQGAAYAVSNIAGTSYQEVDKILMLQVLGAVAVGPYTVAFRIASIFVLPVSALISATLPRLMALHADGNKSGTFRVVMLVSIGYGLLAGIAMLASAPLVPFLFGISFDKATHYLFLLAPWPILFALRQCLATELTVSDRQFARSMVEVAAFVLVAVLNIVLLPRIGEAAAAISLLATEVIVSISLWLSIRGWKLLRR